MTYTTNDSYQNFTIDQEVYRELSDRMIEQSDEWTRILGKTVDIWFTQEAHTTYTGWMTTRDFYNNQWDYQVTVRVDGLDNIDFGTVDAALGWMERMFGGELALP